MTEPRNYRPEPIDTSRIELEADVRELVERLGKHVHDSWALRRLSEGWTYGPVRDDAEKKHPDLVPYEQLRESEKDYDRVTAEATLKAVLAMGGHISYRAPPDAHLCASLGERIFRAGEPLMAYDVLAQGLEHWPHDMRLRQLAAVALERSGATRRALEIVTALYEEGHADGETLGILASAHKTLAVRARGAVTRGEHLRKALEHYEHGFRSAVGENRVEDAYYTGINASTLSLLRGDADRARNLAKQVRQICLERAASGKDDYWVEPRSARWHFSWGNAETRRSTTPRPPRRGDSAT